MINKNRLIYAGPVGEYLENKARSWSGTFCGPAYADALERVKAAPTVGTVPVAHGSREIGDRANPQMPTCSVCKNRATFRTKYCPSCGANMDGEANATK